ncbi:MAG: hypothetical protein ACPG51_17300 [Thiolinea sp.]
MSAKKRNDARATNNKNTPLSELQAGFRVTLRITPEVEYVALRQGFNCNDGGWKLSITNKPKTC